MLLCVCVCVRERERERERNWVQFRLNLILEVIHFFVKGIEVGGKNGQNRVWAQKNET